MSYSPDAMYGQPQQVLVQHGVPAHSQYMGIPNDGNYNALAAINMFPAQDSLYNKNDHNDNSHAAQYSGFAVAGPPSSQIAHGPSPSQQQQHDLHQQHSQAHGAHQSHGFPPHMQYGMQQPYMMSVPPQQHQMQSNMGLASGYYAAMPPQVARVSGYEGGKREKVHMSILDKLAKIEREFLERKDALYEHKALELRRELQEIQRSIHPEYIEGLNVLAMAYNLDMKKANSRKEFADASLERWLIADRQLAEDEYKTERNTLRETMLKQIEERRAKIAEEKDALTIDSELAADNQNTRAAKTRLNRNRRGDSAAPAESAPASPGPIIMYSGTGKRKRAFIVEKVAPPMLGLTEDEINEDLLNLQKLGASGRSRKKPKK